MSPLQDTLETSMCARNTLPACYGPVKGSPIPLWTSRIKSPKRREDTSGRGAGWLFAGPSSVGNRRATAYRDRFFACGETAIAPLPALGANRDVSSVSCKQPPGSSSWHCLYSRTNPLLHWTFMGKSTAQKSAGGVWRFLGGSQNTSFTTRAGAITRLHFSSR